MLSQRLRHRIDIEALSITQDSTTGVVSEAWVSIRALGEPGIPAEIVALSGREFTAAAKENADVTTRITMRRRAGLLPSMRVVHEGQIYNIRAILPDPSLRTHITLMCSVGANEG